MPFNIDPFQAYLPAPQIPGSSEGLSEEDRLRRQTRLKEMGLQDSVLGKVNDLGLKSAVAKSGVKSALSSGGSAWMASL